MKINTSNLTSKKVTELDLQIIYANDIKIPFKLTVDAAVVESDLFTATTLSFIVHNI